MSDAICVKCNWPCTKSVIRLFGVGPLCPDCAYTKLCKAYDRLSNSKQLVFKQMNNTIHPNEELAEGTVVQVIGKGKATVVKAEHTRDQHGLPIIVHHLRYANGTVKTCNYSFIIRPNVKSIQTPA